MRIASGIMLTFIVVAATVLNAQTASVPPSLVEQAQNLLEATKKPTPAVDPLDEIIGKLDEVIERGRRVKSAIEAEEADGSKVPRVAAAARGTTSQGDPQPVDSAVRPAAEAGEIASLVRELRDLVTQLRDVLALYKKDE